MKIKSTMFKIIIAMSFCSFLSCSNDDSDGMDDDIAAGCANFDSEWGTVAQAITAFSQNPNPETCEVYKSAVLEFYNEFRECAYWADSYQEAYDEVQATDCSEVGTD